MNKEMSVSEINSQYTLKYLCQHKEDQYLERKGLGDKNIKASKIAEELIGMLNADGGVLVFGISDDGEVQDLNTLGDGLKDYRTLIYDFIHPTPNIKLEDVTLEDGKLIFLYHVELDLERVFQRKDNEQVYLRVHDTNRKLDREGVRKLEYDKQIRRFEDEFCEEFDIKDFDQELLEDYKEKLNYQGDVLTLISKRFLAQEKEGNLFVKKSAVLLFAENPEKYIPSASVRYVKYEGEKALTGTQHNVVKDIRFENNIPRLIAEIRDFLRKTLKDYYFLNPEDGKFNKVMEYPEEAWLEALVNALCHRSYNIQGNSIYIKHFDDRLEISNSGPLPQQVTVDNIKTERFARNPRIARVLEDMGYVRQLNEGVNRIYESMEKSMLSMPEYREENHNIYLTLRNKISNHSKVISPITIETINEQWNLLNKTEHEILLCLFVNQAVTLNKLEEHTQINVNTIRAYLNKFIELGIVERISEKQRDKNALYRLK